MDTVVRFENVSKRYRIGGLHPGYITLRETLGGMLTAPLRRLKRGANGDGRTTVWALRDINLTIRQGELVGIIGRNGAGKSTLLRILSRVTRPTTGEVEIYGRVGSLLEVGTGFHPDLSGRENIFLNGAILGMRKAEIVRKFDEIVAFAEIEKFLETPVKHYSSGMYVRLAFSVAAHLEPEILIMDEVLAVGDAAFQRKCLAKMHDIARSGHTVLFVSHDIGAVNSLCERVILMHEGSIINSGATRDVTAEYLERARVIEPREAREPA
ncbi:MAG: ABC transporter ATP-binding protein [Pyrinomonadaceae bacterium]